MLLWNAASVKAIACGGDNVLVSDAGAILTTMAIEKGECVAAQSFRLPDMLPTEEILSVSSGRSHFAAVSHHGQLYTWGCGADGRLGHGGNEDEECPRVVSKATRA